MMKYFSLVFLFTLASGIFYWFATQEPETTETKPMSITETKKKPNLNQSTGEQQLEKKPLLTQTTDQNLNKPKEDPMTLEDAASKLEDLGGLKALNSVDSEEQRQEIGEIAQELNRLSKADIERRLAEISQSIADYRNEHKDRVAELKQSFEVIHEEQEL